jgi:hypothetical protein
MKWIGAQFIRFDRMLSEIAQPRPMIVVFDPRLPAEVMVLPTLEVDPVTGRRYYGVTKHQYIFMRDRLYTIRGEDIHEYADFVFMPPGERKYTASLPDESPADLSAEPDASPDAPHVLTIQIHAP